MSMRKWTSIFILSILILVSSLTSIQASSLWNDVTGNIYQDVQRDRRASTIGDIIRVIIIEESQATQQASSDATKSSRIEAGPGLGIFDFFEAFRLSGGDAFDTQGVTTRRGALNAEMSVQILDILDSGNFLVGGHKYIILNEEEQMISLTGVVRPGDIRVDNTIDSIHIADVRIEYKGEGIIGDYQKPGLLTRFLRWLF